MLKLGEVKLPCDDDFNYIKNICEQDQGWNLEYNKNKIRVFTQKNELSSFNMLKLIADFEDISANLLYNVLQDGDFRSIWDNHMIESIYQN